MDSVKLQRVILKPFGSSYESPFWAVGIEDAHGIESPGYRCGYLVVPFTPRDGSQPTHYIVQSKLVGFPPDYLKILDIDGNAKEVLEKAKGLCKKFAEEEAIERAKQKGLTAVEIGRNGESVRVIKK